MKTFAALQAFFEDTLEHFPPSVDQPVTLAWLEALSPADREAADAACRAFATTLDWPEMRSDVRQQVWLRLEFARVDAGLMNLRTRGGSLPEEIEGTELLQYALIARWHQEGLNWLRLLERRPPS